MMHTTDSTQSSSNIFHSLILLPKLFLIITVIFIMWIVILISGPLFGVLDPDWAGLSSSLWVLLISVLIGAFIVIDIILYATPMINKNETMFSPVQTVEFPEIEKRDGKTVYDYTYPGSTQGGVFSKTYVQVDDQTVIRIRNQMITKEQLWD